MAWLLLIIGGFAVGCRLSSTSDSDTGAAVWHWWHCQWHGHLHVHPGAVNSWCRWICWLEGSGQFGTDAKPGWSHRGQTLRCAAHTASAVPWCEYHAAACLMACNYSWLPQPGVFHSLCWLSVTLTVNPHIHHMKQLKHRYCRCRPLVVTFVYYEFGTLSCATKLGR